MRCHLVRPQPGPDRARRGGWPTSWSRTGAWLAVPLLTLTLNGCSESPPASHDSSPDSAAGATAPGMTGTSPAPPTTTRPGRACDAQLAYFGTLSGPAAGRGVGIKQGAQLAVADYNREHPDCPVGFRSYDSGGDPTKTAVVARQVVRNTKLVGVVGPPSSEEARAAVPVFQEAELHVITPSASESTLGEQGWSVFHRLSGTDAAQAAAGAAYLKDTLKVRRVVVIDDGTRYGVGLADAVVEALGELSVGRESVTTASGSVAAVVTRTMEPSPDAVFFAGYPALGATTLTQLRAAGWKGMLVGSDGLNDAAFPRAAGVAAEGAAVLCLCAPEHTDNPKNADNPHTDFATAYRRVFGSPPGAYAAEAYDAANAFLDAIAKNKTSSSEVGEHLKSYNTAGITRRVRFDANGEGSDVSVWSYKVVGGVIVPEEKL